MGRTTDYPDTWNSRAGKRTCGGEDGPCDACLNGQTAAVAAASVASAAGISPQMYVCPPEPPAEKGGIGSPKSLKDVVAEREDTKKCEPELPDLNDDPQWVQRQADKAAVIELILSYRNPASDAVKLRQIKVVID